MELLDLYDIHLKKTGQIIERGQQTPKNSFYSVIHVWPVNSSGQILIQKRAETVQWNPCIWACTSGAVSSGEDFLTACKRELKEELSVIADEADLSLAGIFKRVTNYCCVWIYKKEIDIKDIVLQKEEVSDVKWVTIPELKKMIIQNEFYNYSYTDWILWYIANL